MGNYNSIQKINFEDIQYINQNINQNINQENNYLLINTLPENLQDCLIPNTLNINQEEEVINNLLKTNKYVSIIIYGKNCNDMTIYKKYDQLSKLGFTKLYIYPGGLFEWLCLQEIYTDEYFPTSKKELDLLKYKPKSILSNLYIMNELD